MKLKEMIVTELRKAIIEGQFAPGDRLVEGELCSRYRVSRTPIREALNQLETEGLVAITPGAGARIARLSRKDLIDIYDLLIVLEGAASRLACDQITEGELAKLEEYLFLFGQAMQKNDHELIFQLNLRFHWLITEATKNRYLIEMRLNFRRLIDGISRLFPQIPQQCAASMAEHRAIIDGMKARNPSLAEFLMREHLEGAKRHLVDYLDTRQNEPEQGYDRVYQKGRGRLVKDK
jgi:DNA-binding GntR family transcriptional regulator